MVEEEGHRSMPSQVPRGDALMKDTALEALLHGYRCSLWLLDIRDPPEDSIRGVALLALSSLESLLDRAGMTQHCPMSTECVSLPHSHGVPGLFFGFSRCHLTEGLTHRVGQAGLTAF